MSRKKHEGWCSICGSEGELSEEHVPPKSAFNTYDVVMATWEQISKVGPEGDFKGRVQQGGVKYYTICERCNNNTGKWYCPSFAQFCYQGMQKLQLSGGRPTLYYTFQIFPLRVIKQIVTMFFSLNQSLGKNTPYLSRFVLNRETQYLPDDINIYLYYNSGGRLRYSAGVVRASIDGSMPMCHFSELSFPPFGYVFSFTGGAPDKRLIDITHFARYKHNDWVDIQLRLPALETHMAMPGDYRTVEEIKKDYAANQAFAKS